MLPFGLRSTLSPGLLTVLPILSGAQAEDAQFVPGCFSADLEGKAWSLGLVLGLAGSSAVSGYAWHGNNGQAPLHPVRVDPF